MFNLKIVGASVVDGTGAPGFRADAGIRDELIAAVGDLSREPAGLTLRAHGLTLAVLLGESLHKRVRDVKPQVSPP